MTAAVALPRPTTQFRFPDADTATEPPEHRGLARDGVRLLVADGAGVRHRVFRDLADELDPGDVLVVNTSATVAAELDGRLVDGSAVVVHVAAELPDGCWVVELRTAPDAADPILDLCPGERIALRGAGLAVLRHPYPAEGSSPTGNGNRLWTATFASDRTGGDRTAGDRTGADRLSYLAAYGRPISYGYLTGRFPLTEYQTVFSTTPGSAEMASAARPFSTALVTRLVSRGVSFVPVLLHTGVSSQDAGEAPQPEFFQVSASSAARLNAAVGRGGRVIAVGTTATRAVESATGPGGRVRPRSGWTDLVIGPERPVRVVNGLITGWHNPEASHLLLVESVAGASLTQRAYDAAVAEHYRWHEFGDSCLLLPGRDSARGRSLTGR